MPVYLISYDINEKDAFEYKGLWEELSAIGATRILYSEWIGSSAQSCASIYDRLATKTQDKDRLLVTRLYPEAKWDKLLMVDATFKKIMESA